MRKMILALFLLAVSGCGDDDSGPGGDAPQTSADADPAAPDGEGGGDAPISTVDASSGGGPGALCVTGADPGEFGACMEGLVCCMGTSTICVEPAECPGGNMF